jgi:methylmalonyl-CoA/ethylmalonyl-CoA epimerase
VKRFRILGIDHLGIAVPVLDGARAAYAALGLVADSIHEVESEQVRAAFLPLGETRLELLEPTDPSSTLARFLEKRRGFHHLCLLVDDLDAALAELKARGVRLVDDTPRQGAGGCRVAFIHPSAAAGVLIELKQG